jgi:uncharacterized glyoxalase superfamily protein PhnB
MAYKPKGYTSVSPYLVVDDATVTLDFAASVFAAETLHVVRRDDGTIRHAEIRIDDTVVMVGQMPGGPPAHLHVYLEDPDAAFARALDAGASQVEPIALKEEGERRGGIRDANGTTWWLARAGAQKTAAARSS